MGAKKPQGRGDTRDGMVIHVLFSNIKLLEVDKTLQACAH